MAIKGFFAKLKKEMPMPKHKGMEKDEADGMEDDIMSLDDDPESKSEEMGLPGDGPEPMPDEELQDESKPSMLEEISDDDLMAELKARGLESKLSAPKGKKPSAEDIY